MSLEKQIINAVKAISFPMITNKEYPPGWWHQEFGMSIADSQSREINRLKIKIEKIFKKEGGKK